MKNLHLTFFISLLTCAAFMFPPAAEACTAPLPSPQGVVSGAELIVRATALRYVQAPEGPIRHFNEPPDAEIEFRIEETLKGEKVPPAIILNGYLIDRDDYNDRPVPYDFVRRGGRGGSCSAYEYKQGGEFLLFLRKVDGKLTIRWYPLAPTNEQIRSADDPWVMWVKKQLSENRSDLSQGGKNQVDISGMSYTDAERELKKAIEENNFDAIRSGLRHNAHRIQNIAVEAIAELGDSSFVPELVASLERNRGVVSGGTSTQMLRKKLVRAIVSALEKFTGMEFVLTEAQPKWETEKIVEESREWIRRNSKRPPGN